jgi:HipA-like protein
MGRRSHSQTLHLWANGDYVGRWTVNANGDAELQYDIAWRSSAHGRPISLSMPFNIHNEPLKGAKVSHYFEGLLPDSDIIRKRVAARFNRRLGCGLNHGWKKAHSTSDNFRSRRRASTSPNGKSADLRHSFGFVART